MEPSTGRRALTRRAGRSPARYAKPRQGWRTLLWRWLAAEPTRALGVLAAVGLLVAAPFGGWRQAPPEPAVGVGTPITAGPITLTFHDATYAVEPSEEFRALDYGGTYVMAFATVTSTEPKGIRLSTLDDLVWADSLPEPMSDFDRPVVVEGMRHNTADPYTVLDQASLQGLSPDLDYTVAFVFRLDADPEALTDRLELTVQHPVYRPFSLQSSVSDWLYSEFPEQTTVVLPLREHPGTSAEGEPLWTPADAPGGPRSDDATSTSGGTP